MTAAVIIPATGGAFRTEVNGLEEFQKAVGGYIECVDLPPIEGHTVTAYCNEEGKLAPVWEVNLIASALYGRSDDLIIGPLLVVGPADAEGNDLDLPEEVATYLVAIVGVTT